MDTVVDQLLAAKGLVVAVWLALLFIGERLIPAAVTAPRGRAALARVSRNGALFAVNMGLSVLVVVPLTAAAATGAPAWRPVVLPWWDGWLGLALDLVLLDFLIYWWHRANHVVPILWRFHEVHHLDEHLDSTSAVRFHFGEVLLSACARALVILALDIPLASVLVFETLVLVTTIFHHSNLKLPPRLEAALARVIITPGLHWVHHHAVRADTDSTYGTTFSFWDRLFGTRSRTRRSPDMPIGVERGHEKPLAALVLSPFRARR